MGERKVMNKYFPPDFDPSKIPRVKKATLNPNFVVRMMLPMSLRCETCGEYMYKGKKFNSRKEDVQGPEGEYLGIKIFRFYFKCITCSAEFTIKTDPQSMDYVVEGGAKRNYELYKAEKEEKDEIAKERTVGEADDKMAQLENKTADQKRHLDVLDALDEIKAKNAQDSKMGIDAILAAKREAEQSSDAAKLRGQDTADDEEAAAAFAASRVKRLREADEPPGGAAAVCAGFGAGGSSSGGGGSSASRAASIGKLASKLAPAGAAFSAPAKRSKLPMGVVAVVKKAAPASEPAKPKEAAPAPAGLGLGGYGSSTGSGSGSGSGSPKAE